MYSSFRNTFNFLKIYSQSLSSFRYVRNASKRVAAIKTIKALKVKNNDDYEDYDDFVDEKIINKRIKENDLDIEETFTKGEYLGDVISESRKLYETHISKEKGQRKFIKRQLIGRKYFDAGKETNLLTYAAKEQIRYLNNLDPTEWTPEMIAKSFPISVTGVKKLLKSNFVLKSPEKIKTHDEDVKQKWEILLSGKPTDLISFHTQCLWKAGKLLKENYNGNSNLPKISSTLQQKPITIKKQKTGEFSAIVQKYVEYKAQNQTSKQQTAEIITSETLKTLKPKHEAPILKMSKYIKENKTQTYSNQFEAAELPFSQFKENLKNELNVKNRKSPINKQYYQWLEEDTKENSIVQSKTPFNVKEFITNIPKYNKDDEAYIESKNSYKSNSKEQVVKRKIHIPTKLRNKSSTYKKGQSVYDENGEFLFKLPV